MKLERKCSDCGKVFLEETTESTDHYDLGLNHYCKECWEKFCDNYEPKPYDPFDL